MAPSLAIPHSCGFYALRGRLREAVVQADPQFDAAKRHLAANLARLRKRQSWSQQQLADAAGLDLKHVQRIEYAALNLSLRTLVKLASAFEIELGRLLARTASPMPRRPVGRPPRR